MLELYPLPIISIFKFHFIFPQTSYVVITDSQIVTYMTMYMNHLKVQTILLLLHPVQLKEFAIFVFDGRIAI